MKGVTRDGKEEEGLRILSRNDDVIYEQSLTCGLLDSKKLDVEADKN